MTKRKIAILFAWIVMGVWVYGSSEVFGDDWEPLHYFAGWVGGTVSLFILTERGAHG